MITPEQTSSFSSEPETPKTLITLRLPADAAERLYELFQAGAIQLPADLGELIDLKVSDEDESNK